MSIVQKLLKAVWILNLVHGIVVIVELRSDGPYSNAVVLHGSSLQRRFYEAGMSMNTFKLFEFKFEIIVIKLSTWIWSIYMGFKAQ